MQISLALYMERKGEERYKRGKEIDGERERDRKRRESTRVLVNNIGTWCDENPSVHVLHDHLCTAKERRIWLTMTTHLEHITI